MHMPLKSILAALLIGSPLAIGRNSLAGDSTERVYCAGKGFP